MIGSVTKNGERREIKTYERICNQKRARREMETYDRIYEEMETYDRISDQKRREKRNGNL